MLRGMSKAGEKSPNEEGEDRKVDIGEVSEKRDTRVVMGVGVRAFTVCERLGDDRH